MSSAETVLEAVVGQGEIVTLHVAGLRHGDIETGTGKTTVGGFEQPDVTYAVDYASEDILVQNNGINPWAAGAALVVSWEGVALEATVADHETRITALEAGSGTGEGESGGHTFTGPVYFKGDSSNDYGIYIDSPEAGYGAGIMAFIGGLRRWEVMLGDGSAEVMGTNVGNSFAIGAYSDFGNWQGNALEIRRKDGQVIIKPPLEAVDDAAAALVGVEIGGIYCNGSVLMVRRV